MLRHTTPPSSASATVAAVDLGSNSFHMIVAKVDGADFQVIDKLREMVRLSAGLQNDKRLDSEVEERALNCLERFGQRLTSLPPGSVRAVGTSTLRQMRSSKQFLEKAEQALGHPIEIIAGREEARLVYLGVAHGLAAGDERRLVVDIGGGSTELIVGDGFVAKRMESITMGCVNMSQRFFVDGKITAQAMYGAELTGALEMRPVKNEFRNAGWRLALGASGTIRAIRAVIETAGWTNEGEGITYDTLKRLSDALVDAGHVDKLDLPGLNPERRPVFPGGVAVLRAVFRALSIDQMQVSDKALREGLIYELLGRTHHEDVRESSVRALCRRYDVDMEHTGRVATTARALFAQTAGAWELHGGEYVDILDWAARLNEIGLTVSHSQYHKHGAYLIAHSDMPGFSRQEQLVLAALVRGHRRKFPLEEFDTLPQDERLNAIRLCILLRLAALLHRARSAVTRIDVLMSVTENQLILQFPKGWLEAHTLPRAELELEAKHLKATGFDLQFI